MSERHAKVAYISRPEGLCTPFCILDFFRSFTNPQSRPRYTFLLMICPRIGDGSYEKRYFWCNPAQLGVPCTGTRIDFKDRSWFLNPHNKKDSVIPFMDAEKTTKLLVQAER